MSLGRFLRAGCLGLACYLAAASLAHACKPPETPAAYVINHETYGDIGTHVLTFSCDGDDLIVETEVDVKVKILLVTVYKRKAHLREVWRGDQLIAYDAHTDDGGDVFETRARIDGDELIIDGIEKGVRAPLDTIPSNPWNVSVVERPLVFGQRDGRIHEVSVMRGEPEVLTIGGRRVEAEKFVVEGDLERELLYDADGTWLQWRLKRDGKTITVTRK